MADYGYSPMTQAMAGLSGGLQGFAQAYNARKTLEATAELERFRIESHVDIQNRLIDLQVSQQKHAQEMEEWAMELKEAGLEDETKYKNRMANIEKFRIQTEKSIADMNKQINMARIESDNKDRARNFLVSMLPLITGLGSQAGVDPKVISAASKAMSQTTEVMIGQGYEPDASLAGGMTAFDEIIKRSYPAGRDPTETPEFNQALNALFSSDPDIAPMWDQIKPILMGGPSEKAPVVPGPRTTKEAGKEFVPPTITEAARGLETRTREITALTRSEEAHAREQTKKRKIAEEKLLRAYEEARRGTVELLKKKGLVTVPERIEATPTGFGGAVPVYKPEMKKPIKMIDAMRMKIYSREISDSDSPQRRIELIEDLVSMPEAMIRKRYEQGFPEATVIAEP